MGLILPFRVILHITLGVVPLARLPFRIFVIPLLWKKEKYECFLEHTVEQE